MRFKNAANVRMPMSQRLEAGRYYWCQCGETKNPPFCDGSHGGTEILPLEFKVDVGSTKVICSCGLSNNPPHCDGAHKEY
jgi:CDGSH-type Zn-finger protein